MLGVYQNHTGSCSLILFSCVCMLEGPVCDFMSTGYLFEGLLMDGPTPVKISALSVATIKKQSAEIYAEQYRDGIKIGQRRARAWSDVVSADVVLWRRFRDQQSQSCGEYSNFPIRERVFYRCDCNLGRMWRKQHQRAITAVTAIEHHRGEHLSWITKWIFYSSR